MSRRQSANSKFITPLLTPKKYRKSPHAVIVKTFEGITTSTEFPNAYMAREYAEQITRDYHVEVTIALMISTTCTVQFDDWKKNRHQFN